LDNVHVDPTKHEDAACTTLQPMLVSSAELCLEPDSWQAAGQ